VSTIPQALEGSAMKVLVCGGRDFDDYAKAKEVLGAVSPSPTMIIEGGANGADNLAHMWARANKVAIRQFRANWDKHGKAAGMIRNKEMLDEGKPDLVIAFPGGRGTFDMVSRAIEAGLPTEVVT
tara:strand:+ start:20985 stop:21359 length:375 start_codon:yes stop_codon:yes gene_type:complete